MLKSTLKEILQIKSLWRLTAGFDPTSVLTYGWWRDSVVNLILIWIWAKNKFFQYIFSQNCTIRSIGFQFISAQVRKKYPEWSDFYDAESQIHCDSCLYGSWLHSHHLTVTKNTHGQFYHVVFHQTNSCPIRVPPETRTHTHTHTHALSVKWSDWLDRVRSRL